MMVRTFLIAVGTLAVILGGLKWLGIIASWKWALWAGAITLGTLVLIAALFFWMFKPAKGFKHVDQ